MVKKEHKKNVLVF